MIHPQSINANKVYEAIGANLNLLESMDYEATLIWLPRDQWEPEIGETTIWGLPVVLTDELDLRQPFRISGHHKVEA